MFISIILWHRLWHLKKWKAFVDDAQRLMYACVTVRNCSVVQYRIKKIPTWPLSISRTIESMPSHLILHRICLRTYRIQCHPGCPFLSGFRTLRFVFPISRMRSVSPTVVIHLDFVAGTVRAVLDAVVSLFGTDRPSARRVNDEVQNRARNVACAEPPLCTQSRCCRQFVKMLFLNCHGRRSKPLVTMATFERSRLGEGAPDMDGTSSHCRSIICLPVSCQQDRPLPTACHRRPLTKPH
jgi:hypothetical protein